MSKIYHNDWKKYIKSRKDNTSIYIITKDEDFYKDDNGQCVFFDNEKQSYDFIMSHKDCKYIPFYLSGYRIY